MYELGSEDAEVWITGTTNFRFQVYPEYKANRIGMHRPKWEQTVKQHMLDRYNAQVAVGCEADDMLGVQQTRYCGRSIIATIDKDLNMIPGRHYNFVKKEQFYVTPNEGIRYFYYQMLVGDTVDNLKGVPGIGKVKAEKLLLQGNTEVEWFNIVRDAYSNDEYMEIMGKCLWIWQEDGGIWSMPFEVTE